MPTDRRETGGILGSSMLLSAVIDRLADHPFLRKVTLRLPKALWPIPPAYGHVIAFDETGKIVAEARSTAIETGKPATTEAGA